MEEWFRESVALGRALSDRRILGESLYGLSLSLGVRGRSVEADPLAQESVANSREAGDWFNLAWGLHAAQSEARRSGEFARSHAMLTEALTLFEELGDRSGMADTHQELAQTEAHLGRYEDARRHYQSGLTLAHETGFTRAIVASLLGLGFLGLAEGAYTEAKGWAQKALNVIQTSGPKSELINALILIACAELELDDRHQARDLYRQAFETAIKQASLWSFPFFFVAQIALLLAAEDQRELAVELYALSCRYPMVKNSQWFEDVVGKHIAAIAASLPPDVVAAAQERGRARDMEATVRELLAELKDQADG
jgi:tetratricopeptide (TPR) repeat protein